eukprot:6205348-Pleurochrysis_carterae.AAC.1
MSGVRVVKVCDLDVSAFSLKAPVKASTKTRESSATGPMIQTEEVTYTMEEGQIEFLCTAEHADKIHAIDDA